MNQPAAQLVARDVARALEEDIGNGDVSAMLVPEGAMATARVITREHMHLSGIAWFDEVFRQVDPLIEVRWAARDSDHLAPNALICTVHGPARGILTGERTALNFVQTLSATATKTHKFVRAVHGTRARILDTRKTLPGLRLAQKYAVT